MPTTKQEEILPKYDKCLTVHLLNASVNTEFGNYIYFPVDLQGAKILANSARITSHIGHSETAALMSDILGRPIEYSRREFHQKVGELALVFKLNKRGPEGKILTRAELEEIGYSFGLLYRVQ